MLYANTDQLQTQLFKKDKQPVSRDVQLAVQKKPTCQQEIPQLRQQLQSFEQKMDMMEKRIQELQQQLSQRGSQKQEEEEASGEAASGDGIELRWKDGCRAPVEMYGEEAASAVNGSVAYFLPRRSEKCTVRVLAYDAVKDDWYKLPKCHKCDFSLAVVNNLLTAIGGNTPKRGHTTNSLLSLTDHDKKWTKHFPEMPTKRSFPAVVCSGKYLVVAGGERHKPLNNVEVLDTKAPNLQWSTASSLPHPLSQATATLCGDKIYVVGGFDRDDATSRSVFACSMAILFQSNGEKVWHSLAGVPATQSTYASLNGRLLAVGGKDSSKSRKSAIHAYNTTTNSWEVIDHMPTPCSQCRVAVLPQNKLMVVGGRTHDGPTYFVKIATIV